MVMIVNMMQNLSNGYFSHYNTIKYISFELIHYVNNLYVISSSMSFNEFDYMFLSNLLLIYTNQ